MISTGIGDSSLPKLRELVDYTDAKWICIDVANGYMNSVVKYAKKVFVKCFLIKLLLLGMLHLKKW